MSVKGTFRMWCQTHIPSLYNPTLSYYELLIKLKDHIDAISADETSAEEQLDELYTVRENLADYITDYFTSVETLEEINEELDKLSLDGTFTSLINDIVEWAINKREENVE